MDKASMLILAMLEECRRLLAESPARDESTVPEALRTMHLLWMCDRIEKNAEQWPATRVHRWIGYLQAALVAKEVIDLRGAKAMFNRAKNDYGDAGDDLIDHLDPKSAFELDIGGQG